MTLLARVTDLGCKQEDGKKEDQQSRNERTSQEQGNLELSGAPGEFTAKSTGQVMAYPWVARPAASGVWRLGANTAFEGALNCK